MTGLVHLSSSDICGDFRWQVMRDLRGPGLLRFRRPTTAGAAPPGTAGGTRRCTRWDCCGNWISIPRAYEQSIDRRPDVTDARLRGQEYLLDRRLFRRRSTGEPIERDRKGGASWTRFAFPTWWHYDMLRGLDYLRRAGVAPDARVAEAIDLVASKHGADGRWLMEAQHAGRMPVEVDEGEGRPSRWITLRALRVLRWGRTANPTY